MTRKSFGSLVIIIISTTHYKKVISEPPNAPITTTSQGGTFQKFSILNKIAAKAKS